MSQGSTFLAQFEALEISPTDFHHEDHLRVAFEMLDTREFVDACSQYAKTINAMAENVGAPEKFNMTITIAFMSLVAERKAQSVANEFERFLAGNPDLLDPSILRAWYSEERLTSPTAHKFFLLPDSREPILSGYPA